MTRQKLTEDIILGAMVGFVSLGLGSCLPILYKSASKVPSTTRVEAQEQYRPFNLKRRITTKQFTASPTQGQLDYDTWSQAKVNKRATKKANHYLRNVKNLKNYHIYISRDSDVGSRDSNNEVTVTVTFVRK